jgi:hypothetical protein
VDQNGVRSGIGVKEAAERLAITKKEMVVDLIE